MAHSPQPCIRRIIDDPDHDAGMRIGDQAPGGGPILDGGLMTMGRYGRRERAELAALSWALIAEARNASGDERERLLRLADAAARHGEALPEARTRRQALAAIAEEKRARGERVDPDSVAEAFARQRDEAERARDGAERDPESDARMDGQGQRSELSQRLIYLPILLI